MKYHLLLGTIRSHFNIKCESIPEELPGGRFQKNGRQGRKRPNSFFRLTPQSKFPRIPPFTRFVTVTSSGSLQTLGRCGDTPVKTKMPGYKTHITASSILGAALGGISFLGGGVDVSSAIYGGALCAIGGMVPDIDSKTSTSFRKCLAIISGFSSLLLVSRLRDFMLDPETVALIGGGNFVLCWFFVGGIIRKTTNHRGMCHSIPMAILTGEIAFLLSSEGVNERVFCGCAAALGVLCHLVLDEFYSVQVKGVSIKVKKSLGSALKLVNFDDKKASFFMLLLLGLVTFVTVREPVWSEQVTQKETAKHVKKFGKEELRQIQDDNAGVYDLSVVEWAMKNDLQIRPRRSGNRKWKELGNLLSSPESEENTERSRRHQRKRVTAQNRPSSFGNPQWSAQILEQISSDDGTNADGSGVSFELDKSSDRH